MFVVTKKSRSIKPLVLATKLALGLLLVNPVAQAEQAIKFKQTSGSLANCLNQIAEQGNVYLSADANLTRAKKCGSFQGQQTLAQRFVHVLAGTDLAVIEQGDGQYLLKQQTIGKLPDMTVSDTEIIEVYGRQLGYHAGDASTATKMDMSLLETPMSVFVINSALIEDQQAFRFDQILQNDASVQKSNNAFGAYSSYSIRGFDLDNAANYLLNGRKYVNLAASPVETLERVEVLKGPASVLYGTVTPGGMINMISKRAQAKSHASVKYTYGSYDLQHLAVDFGGSVDEEGRFRYRINGVLEDSNSYRKFGNGEEFSTERRIGAIALAWDITDNTELSFNYDYSKDDRPQDTGLVAIGNGVADMDYNTIIVQPWGHYNSEVKNILAEVKHQLNEHWKFKAGYSLQDFHRDRYDQGVRGLDEETGDISIRARHRSRDADYQTIYLDLQGEINLFEMTHNILFGIDNYKEEVTSFWTTGSETFETNIYQPKYFADPNIGTVPDGGWNNDHNSVYFQDMIELNDQWRLMLGLRYDDFATSDGSGDPVWNYSDSNLTPRAGLVYLPTEQLSFYASYSESFEYNGGVDSDYLNGGDLLDPTIGKQYEVGAKWQGFEGDLLVTAAVYDIARSGATTESNDGDYIEQRGLQEHRGAEFSITGLIGEQLSLVSSVAFIDAEFKNDENAAVIGNRPAGVAEVSASLWAEYQLTAQQLKGLSLQAGWFYESKRQGDNENSFELDAYHRFDLGMKYSHQFSNKQELILRLTGSNITDEKYYKSDDRLEVNPERPREIRVSAEFNF